MANQLDIDPRLGDAVLHTVEAMTGVQAHLIMIILPYTTVSDTHDKLENPCFVTSMHPDDMDQVLKQIVEQRPHVGDPIISKALVVERNMEDDTGSPDTMP